MWRKLEFFIRGKQVNILKGVSVFCNSSSLFLKLLASVFYFLWRPRILLNPSSRSCFQKEDQWASSLVNTKLVAKESSDIARWIQHYFLALLYHNQLLFFVYFESNRIKNAVLHFIILFLSIHKYETLNDLIEHFQ